MNSVETLRLLDLAKSATGSDYRTAALIHVTRFRVSDWRRGREAIPPADVALLAHLAGLDAVAWTARAIVEPHAGTPKGDALGNAFKKALAATGAAMLSGGAAAREWLHTMYKLSGYSVT